MLKEFAWKAFEETGSIDAYVFYKEIEDKIKVEKNSTFVEDEVAVSN